MDDFWILKRFKINFSVNIQISCVDQGPKPRMNRNFSSTKTHKKIYQPANRTATAKIAQNRTKAQYGSAAVRFAGLNPWVLPYRSPSRSPGSTSVTRHFTHYDRISHRRSKSQSFEKWPAHSGKTFRVGISSKSSNLLQNSLGERAL